MATGLLGVAAPPFAQPPTTVTTHEKGLVETFVDVIPSAPTILTPAEGATVSGVVTVRVSVPAATDWVGVYACGGASVGEDLEPDGPNEYSVQWDTAAMPECTNGEHGLEAWAFDDDGSNYGNHAITVNVQNEPPPPPPPPTTCDPSGEPGPIAGQGYTQRFADCFDTLDRTVWCSHQWWEPNPPFGTQYALDGVLHLVSRRVDGYQHSTVSSEPCGQANPQSFQQGYLEARIRWTGGDGSWPAFWLLSTAHATNPNWPQPACPNPDCLAAELDVMEGQGGTPFDFYGTVHRNSCNCYGVANEQNANNWHPQAFRLADVWHTYAAKWTGTEVSWYIDGVFSHSTSVYDSFNQSMFLTLSMWAGGWIGEPNASTPDELHTEVDWVRVWQQ